MPNKIFRSKELKARRRELRKADIACERILWMRIRSRQLGYKFKRQESIGNYVVNFYCPQLKLVLEIDGATHSTHEELEYDKIRQKYLENLSLTVKRYQNIDVKENLLELLYDLVRACKELELRLNS